MTSWLRITVVGSIFAAAGAGCGGTAGTEGNPGPAQVPAGSAGGTAGTAGDKGAAPASCADRARALGEQIDKAEPGYIQEQAGPVSRASGEPIRQGGSTMRVDASGRVLFEGKDLGDDRTELADFWRAKQASNAYHGRAGEPVYLWVDPALQLGRLAEIAAVLAGSELRFVVIAAERQPEPRLLAVPSVKRLHDQAVADRSKSVLLVAEPVQAAMAACEPLFRALNTAALTRGNQERDVTGRAVSEALRACDCRIPDLDLFEYGLLSGLGLYRPRLAWRPVPSAESMRKRRDRKVADLITERR